VHKSHSKNHNINITSKLLFEQGICKIYLVEEFPTDNKMLLHQRERWYIENNECVNKCLPGRTKKEWEVDNKEHILNHQKDYYNANKEQKKIYQLQNADKIKQYQINYRIQNSDKINQQSKAYRARKKLEKSLEPN
jgi:adenylate kinase family enzyme